MLIKAMKSLAMHRMHFLLCALPGAPGEVYTIFHGTGIWGSQDIFLPAFFLGAYYKKKKQSHAMATPPEQVCVWDTFLYCEKMMWSLQVSQERWLTHNTSNTNSKKRAFGCGLHRLEPCSFQMTAASGILLMPKCYTTCRIPGSIPSWQNRLWQG